MSGKTFMNLILAETPEEREKARKAHREAVKNEPSDAEFLTAFLRECQTERGEDILEPDESVSFKDGKLVVFKT